MERLSSNLWRVQRELLQIFRDNESIGVHLGDLPKFFAPSQTDWKDMITVLIEKQAIVRDESGRWRLQADMDGQK